MKKYAFKNAKTEDLWSVLSEESGVEVNKIMDIWTKQTGYPVISVNSKDHILEFEQSQFISSGLHGDGQWIVPVTLSLGSNSRCINFLLENTVGRLDISEFYNSFKTSSDSNDNKDQAEFDEKLWVKVNVGQTGFYRVKYDHTLTLRLREAIADNCLPAEDNVSKILLVLISMKAYWMIHMLSARLAKCQYYLSFL